MKNKNDGTQSSPAIEIVSGSPLPMTVAGKVQILTDLMNLTIKTGKPGRPRKLLTLAQLKKLFKDMF